ncbi:SagB family peptide dehydrogenase [Lactobacillus sp. DCY120]|uniref:SagB family peptide dehydrogenase n=1 Tax=Bombilactobacillus apium TaxID=2675299 RepID=A0A850R9W2_9LACO|nr:SagB family peptide dehydrogenase [Bombilactobacillus apium]NVY96176.1 SagB family peptide dehydrogenase [Bombilactobacillus apium]
MSWKKENDPYLDIKSMLDFHFRSIHSETNMSANIIRRGLVKNNEIKSCYLKMNSISLSELGDFETIDISFVDVLKRRRTSWDFNEEPIQCSTLSSIIHYSLGITDNCKYGDFIVNKRAYPSAGAEYSIIPYIYIQGTGNDLIDHKIFKMEIQSEKLYLVNKLNDKEINGICSTSKFTDRNFNKCNFIIFFATNFEVLFSKYGMLSYRLSLLEAGHMCENIQLVSTALNVSTVPLGGFYDNFVRRICKLDGRNFVLYILGGG